MDNPHGKIPIWFFIGGVLLVYGLMICGAGVYALFRPETQAVVLSEYHPDLWWGGLMVVVGAFYTIRFRPGAVK